MACEIPSLTIVYWTVYSGTNQRKHQSSASLAFVRGIHQWPVNSPHKGPVMRKKFPFDDIIVIVLCHHDGHDWNHAFSCQDKLLTLSNMFCIQPGLSTPDDNFLQLHIYVKYVKYQCDSKDLALVTGTLTKLEITLTKKLRDGVSVTPTTGPVRVLTHKHGVLY